MKKIEKKIEKIKDGVVYNGNNFAIEVKENSEGIIVDVFQRDGDLVDTQTYWNFF